MLAPHHPLQAAEMRQQPLAPLGADAADLLQRRGHARLAAARAVAGDGEAVRLVADRLDQVQAGIVARKPDAASSRPRRSAAPARACAPRPWPRR